MSAGKCWYGDLNGKYLYVKWDTNAGDNGFKVSIKDQSSKPEETDNLYLFGQLGYSVCNGNWSDTYTSQCVLKKSGEKDGYPLYTGEIKFQQGFNKFRIHTGSKQVCPQNDNADGTTFVFGSAFYTKEYNSNNQHWRYTASAAETCDVELIYYSDTNYGVTISKKQEVTYPANLYLYKRNGNENSWSVFATLTPDASHNYTATKTVGNDGFSVADCHLILCESNLGDNKAWDEITTALKWTPGKDINLTNAGNTEIKKNQSSGAIKWAFNDNTANVVTFAATLTSATAGTFNISYTTTTVAEGPEHIYIFGKLGYGSEDWNTHTNHCTLSKNGEFEDGHTVYTGKIKFAEGQNWFQFWDGSKQIGTSGGNKTVYLNAPIRETGNYVNNASFGYSEGKGEYDVKLVYYGEYDYMFTIIDEDLTPEVLYLYDRDNIQQSIALNKVSKGKYRIEYNNPTVDLSKGTYHWFLSEEDKTNANSMADFKNRYTTVAEKDIRLSNNDARTSISQNNANAAMEWHLESRRNAEITKVTITADIVNNLFVISTEVSTSATKFYLTGDINNWATEDNDFSDYLPPFRFMPATSEELGKAGLSGQTGWYTLYVPRMHGQFQIHDGKWTTDANFHVKFGNSYDEDTNHHEYWRPIDETQFIKEYMKHTVPESLPSESNLAKLESGNTTYLNMHLDHNYYNNAVIYFNPNDKKLFIDGNSEDIYIYYYNAWNQGSNVETGAFKVQAEDMNANNLNYYYDKTRLSNNMELHTLTEEEWAVPVVNEKVARGHQVYRTTVPPGLEEAYKTNSGKHYFQFYMDGTKKLTANDKYTIDGKSYYFLYNDILPAVLLSYSVNTGTDQAPVFSEVKIGSEGCPIVKAQFRLILRDNEGKPHYIKADKVSTTDKRSEARIFTLDNIVDQSIFAGQSNHGFNPPEEKSSWHYSKKEATVSLMSTNAVDQHWTLSHDANTISSGNASRYIEFDITRRDPDPDDGKEAGTYHEFHSDFNYTDDKYVTDADIDTRAKLGSIKDGAAQNPKFRLNNRDYFASLNSLMAIPTGVENIVTDNEDANAKPVYYNLQGVRVAHPDKGIYIMVKGKTSKKIRF